MSDLISFNPNRLKFARKRRGLTIVALSSALNITPKTLSNYENGKFEPKDLIDLIAEQLKFPKSFFFKDDIASLDETSVSFRSLSRMTASVRDSALCAAQIAIEFTTWINNKFRLPQPCIPDLNDFDPETAAVTLRDEWAIGELSINNMVHMLESKGVRVFSLSERTLDMDAFSFWIDDQPFVFLNTQKSVERSRFDAAHELGHLVLHKHGTPLGKEAETQAQKFASAFLMPGRSVAARIPHSPSITLNSIINLKSIWKVAASALVRRMYDLNFLSEWIYRNLVIEMSKSGYLKNEPNAIKQRETSKLLPMVFEALRKEGITKDDIAKDICVFSDEIDSLVFGLAIIGLSGKSNKQSGVASENSPKKYLRRVK